MVVKKFKQLMSSQRYYEQKTSLRNLLIIILLSFTIGISSYLIAGFKIINNPEIAFHLTQVPPIFYLCSLLFLSMTVTIAQSVMTILDLFQQEKERKHEFDHI